MFLKKIISQKIYTVLFFLFFSLQGAFGSETSAKIEKYIKNLNFFSSKFVQFDGSSVEEGYLHVKDSKIRLDYFYPDRTLIISERKGVYINHELKEEEFFSTEKNIVKIFYDIFLDYNYFSSMMFKESKGGIVFERNLTIDSNKINLKILFENNPLLLRKIIAETKDEIISISFNEHKYNNTYKKKFFSFVPMYPN